MSTAVKKKPFDWVLILCWTALVAFGWLNIYSSSYSAEGAVFLGMSGRAFMQLVWVGICSLLAIALLHWINPQIYIGLNLWLYIFVAALLAAVLVIGKDVNGSRSWFVLGPIRLQPSEFSKLTTALLLSVVVGRFDFKFNLKGILKILLIVGIPAALVLLEPDFGTILVFCGLVFVLYREGLTGWVIIYAAIAVILFILTLIFSISVAVTVFFGFWCLYRLLAFRTKKDYFRPMLLYLACIAALAVIEYFLVSYEYISPAAALLMAVGISIAEGRRHLPWFKPLCILIAAVAVTFSVDYVFENVLKQHHRDRIENLLGITQDLQGAGYNVNQSKIAIGSGGLMGKGFLQGTQTKFDFVPEQSTDFIFCTIGEEWGFVGCVAVLAIYLIMIIRLISRSEKCPDPVTRVFVYCLASYLFVHVVVNVGMTIGLMPVVGIPLPFISYGGSSFLTFTAMLFVFIRLERR